MRELPPKMPGGGMSPPTGIPPRRQSLSAIPPRGPPPNRGNGKMIANSPKEPKGAGPNSPKPKGPPPRGPPPRGPPGYYLGRPSLSMGKIFNLVRIRIIFMDINVYLITQTCSASALWLLMSF